MEAVVAERITVRRDRMVFDVRFAPFARATTPALAEAAVAAFPHLPHHACVHGSVPAAETPHANPRTFGAVMSNTPLPHLLEHLIIDLQTHDPASPANFSFVGTSEWTDEARGVARIEVKFADDLVALRAFRDATRFINKSVLP